MDYYSIEITGMGRRMQLSLGLAAWRFAKRNRVYAGIRRDVRTDTQAFQPHVLAIADRRAGGERHLLQRGAVSAAARAAPALPDRLGFGGRLLDLRDLLRVGADDSLKLSLRNRDSFCRETPARNGKTAPWRGALRARLSNKFRGIIAAFSEPRPQGSGFLSFATETSFYFTFANNFPSTFTA